MAWSPDSKHIAFTKSMTVAESSEYYYELWLAHLETGDSELLGVKASQPVWSPDSRWIAFTDADRGPLVYETDGDTVAPGYGVATSLAWASNGTLVVSVPGAIRLYDPETGETREARDETGEPVGGAYIWSEDAWSPSGRFVAFTTNGDRYFPANMMVLDVETGHAVTMMDSGGFYPVAWLK
jgi:Tol biopolymer transport system component